ncbi:MAG: M23 family metallopeptidase [Clostridia bacterium]|nr:M23 family metallopeptidase [Clostridia bacterium]
MDYSPKYTDRPERNEYRSRFSFADENAVRSKKPKTKTDYIVRLILLQCVLCAVAVGGILLASKISPSASAKMKSDYERIMSNDMSISQIFGSVGDAARETFAPVSFPEAEVTAKIILDSKDPAGDTAEETVATGEIIGGGEDIASEKAADGTTFAAYTVSAPVTLPLENARLTSPFGYRVNPVSGKYGFHTGIDLAAPENTPVSAAFSGVVRKTGESDVWGKYVLIRHSDGFETYYCHLNDILAQEGTVLRAGETLGLVGSTGWSTGAHLHFEVRIDGIRVDPKPLIFPDEN